MPYAAREIHHGPITRAVSIITEHPARSAIAPTRTKPDMLIGRPLAPWWRGDAQAHVHVLMADAAVGALVLLAHRAQVELGKQRLEGLGVAALNDFRRSHALPLARLWDGLEVHRAHPCQVHMGARVFEELQTDPRTELAACARKSKTNLRLFYQIAARFIPIEATLAAAPRRRPKSPSR
jgi:hypothetical protein